MVDWSSTDLVLVMKLFDFRHRNDYGPEYHLILLRMKRWCLIQATFDLSDFKVPPYLHLSIGGGILIGFAIKIGRIGLNIEVISRDWD
jgi:hypothetical protein